jgi:hypothetical protein
MKSLIIVFFASSIAAMAQTNSVVFSQLLSPTGTVLMTNAEFRCVSGNRIFFMNASGYQCFHATNLNSSVLDQLHISAGDLDAKQKLHDASNAAYWQERATAIAEQNAANAARHQRQYQAAINATTPHQISPAGPPRQNVQVIVIKPEPLVTTGNFLGSH